MIWFNVKSLDALLVEFFIILAGLQINVCNGKSFFSYFSTKTYVVGTQKNRHNETVILSIQNTC